MATSTEKALEKFFTPERLAYYRELHERYPLWCGEWPEPKRSSDEHRSWSWFYLSCLELEELASELDWVSVEDQDSDGIPERVFVRPENEGTPVQVALPVIWQATFRALTLCFAPPEFPRDEEIFDGWIAAFGKLFEYDESAWVGATRLVVSPDAEPQSVHGAYLWALRAKAVAAAGKRDKPVEDLEEYWVRIGREIGVIPTFPKGGQLCGLPDQFLAALQAEAERLVKDLVELEPRDDEVSAVRELLAAGKDPFTDLQRERLDSLRRQGKEQEATARREKYLAAAIPDDEVLGRMRQLRFPMLSEPEIENVFERTGGKPYRRSVVAAASDSLAGRLPIERTTLLNRLHQAR